LLLTGSIAALVYAYLVRFLGVALDSECRPRQDHRVWMMRRAAWVIRRARHCAASICLRCAAAVHCRADCFVDVMKELPATFVMRPFNFDTLAVQAYNLASDERLSEAATASLVIVLVGLLPVVLLSRAIRRDRRE
jgi:iron(III) transport system permease protein